MRLAHLDLTGVACATRVLARQRPSPSRTQLIGVQSRQCAAASDADVRAARQPLVYELIHRVLHTIIQRRSGFVEEDQRWLGGQNPAGRSAAAARLATASCPSQTPRPAGRPDARSCTCARCPGLPCQLRSRVVLPLPDASSTSNDAPPACRDAAFRSAACSPEQLCSDARDALTGRDAAIASRGCRGCRPPSPAQPPGQLYRTLGRLRCFRAALPNQVELRAP